MLHKSVHWGPRYDRMNIYIISHIECSANWDGSQQLEEPGQFTLISMGKLGIHETISRAPMNQFPLKFCC